MTTEEEILADNDLMDQLRDSDEDIKAGRVSDWDEFMREFGL